MILIPSFQADTIFMITTGLPILQRYETGSTIPVSMSLSYRKKNIIHYLETNRTWALLKYDRRRLQTDSEYKAHYLYTNPKHNWEMKYLFLFQHLWIKTTTIRLHFLEMIYYRPMGQHHLMIQTVTNHLYFSGEPWTSALQVCDRLDSLWSHH